MLSAGARSCSAEGGEEVAEAEGSRQTSSSRRPSSIGTPIARIELPAGAEATSAPYSPPVRPVAARSVAAIAASPCGVGRVPATHERRWGPWRGSPSSLGRTSSCAKPRAAAERPRPWRESIAVAPEDHGWHIEVRSFIALTGGSSCVATEPLSENCGSCRSHTVVAPVSSMPPHWRCIRKRAASVSCSAGESSALSTKYDSNGESDASCSGASKKAARSAAASLASTKPALTASALACIPHAAHQPSSLPPPPLPSRSSATAAVAAACHSVAPVALPSSTSAAP